MDPQDRQNIVVLLVAALLVAAALLVLHFYSGGIAMEKCRMEGRRDCQPLAVDAD